MSESSSLDSLDSMDIYDGSDDSNDSDDSDDSGSSEYSDDSEMDDPFQTMLDPLTRKDFHLPHMKRKITESLDTNLGPINPISTLFPRSSEQYIRLAPPAKVYSPHLKTPLPVKKHAPRRATTEIAAKVVQDQLRPTIPRFHPDETIEDIRRNMDFLLDEPNVIHNLTVADQSFNSHQFALMNTWMAMAREARREKLESKMRLTAKRRPTSSGGRFLTDRCSSSTYALAQGETPPPEAMVCSEAGKPCMRHMYDQDGQSKMDNTQQPDRQSEMAQCGPTTISPQLLQHLPEPIESEIPAYDPFEKDFEDALFEMNHGPACEYCNRYKPSFPINPPTPTWLANPNFKGPKASDMVGHMTREMAYMFLN